MRAYRIYLLTKAGHIEGPPSVVTCDTDEEAIQQAKQLKDGHDLEVWDQSRRVGVIKSDAE